MMRQDRFTQQAQEVLAASQDLVRQQKHSQWDVEHVLLSLLQHPDGLAGKILEKLDVKVNELRDKVAAHLAQAPKLAHDVGQIYTTPRIVKLLEMANSEAERFKDEYVSVEHLLIAIADERDGDASRLMREAGRRSSSKNRGLQEVLGGKRLATPAAGNPYNAREK